MKIRKHKSKGKETDTDVPSHFSISLLIYQSYLLILYITSIFSLFFILPPFLRFFLFFSKERDEDEMCLCGW